MMLLAATVSSFPAAFVPFRDCGLFHIHAHQANSVQSSRISAFNTSADALPKVIDTSSSGTSPISAPLPPAAGENDGSLLWIACLSRTFRIGRINLYGSFYCSRGRLPRSRRRKARSSRQARSPGASGGSLSYNSSKASLNILTPTFRPTSRPRCGSTPWRPGSLGHGRQASRPSASAP